MYQFCRDYAEENGYTIKIDNQNQSGDPEGQGVDNNYQDYEDVTGEKQYISQEELSEMESVIYSISFGK